MVIFAKLPRREMKELSDEELEKYASLAESGTTGKRLALQELNRRRLKHSSTFHWSLSPRNCLFVIAIIVAVVVAVLIARQP